jgi:hypothetical protein
MSTLSYLESAAPHLPHAGRESAADTPAELVFDEEADGGASGSRTAAAGGSSAASLVELILKDRPGLERLVREPAPKGDLVPRFLAISIVGFVLFGLGTTLVLHAAGKWPRLADIGAWLEAPANGSPIRLDAVDPERSVLVLFASGAALKLTAAYALGLIAATCICLPSLYFYGLLSGVRMNLLDVVVHALKAKATAAVALVGILPIYAAFCMGLVIFHAPEQVSSPALYGALLLPFVAGVWGTRSLYVGFAKLADTLPAHFREKRECFLRRLVLAWSACYTAITPVMIYTLWQSLGT